MPLLVFPHTIDYLKSEVSDQSCNSFLSSFSENCWCSSVSVLHVTRIRFLHRNRNRHFSNLLEPARLNTCRSSNRSIKYVCPAHVLFGSHGYERVTKWSGKRERGVHDRFPDVLWWERPEIALFRQKLGDEWQKAPSASACVW